LRHLHYSILIAKHFRLSQNENIRTDSHDAGNFRNLWMLRLLSYY
jgi:hypothetical protein